MTQVDLTADTAREISEAIHQFVVDHPGAFCNPSGEFQTFRASRLGDPARPSLGG